LSLPGLRVSFRMSFWRAGESQNIRGDDPMVFDYAFCFRSSVSIVRGRFQANFCNKNSET
jgi:hypothetical protein